MYTSLPAPVVRLLQAALRHVQHKVSKAIRRSPVVSCVCRVFVSQPVYK